MARPRSRALLRISAANGGTVFLDEIGDMTLATQAKILRLLQDGRFQRVGGNETITTDVRVIAATNRDLEEAIRTGKFREDLFYRLNVFAIRLPPLRERMEDLPLLVDHLSDDAPGQTKRPGLECFQPGIQSFPLSCGVASCSGARYWNAAGTSFPPRQASKPQTLNQSRCPFSDAFCPDIDTIAAAGADLNGPERQQVVV